LTHHHRPSKEVVGLVALFLLVGGLFLPSLSSALTVDFYCITYNDITDCNSAELQIQMKIEDLGGHEVLFTFENLGPDASSIADIYFEGNSLKRITSVDDGQSGVAFSLMASPSNLPGGRGIGDPFLANFSLDSDTPVQPMGVNPGERLGVAFLLRNCTTLPDLLGELASGELRMGIHVQGFSGGGSESLISTPVPETGTALLLGIGLMGLASQRRRLKAPSQP